ncbi:MAG: type II methionyl aminopeptidase [Candidatus Woesearchaeota archaeon]
MILNDDDVDKAKLAGKIAAKAITYGRTLIKPGVRVVDVLDQVEDFIIQNNGRMAFPAQIAINELAAHFCPLADDETIIKSTDMIKFDLGVHIDGIIADNAITIIFKEDNEKYEELKTIKQASEEALKNALNIVEPGITLGEIGLMIQETIAKYDLSPIKNLSGHGLGRYSVHESPTIPNYNTSDETELEHNQIVAIEPFATNGNGMVFESSNPTLFSVSNIRPVRSPYAREVLAEIKKFDNLPFTTRWLTKNINPGKVRLALTELRNYGIIHDYPPLIESKRGIVSQAEHTIIIRDKPIITTMRDE